MLNFWLHLALMLLLPQLSVESTPFLLFLSLFLVCLFNHFFFFFRSSLWVDVDMSFDMGDTDRDSSISLQVILNEHTHKDNTHKFSDNSGG